MKEESSLTAMTSGQVIASPSGLGSAAGLYSLVPIFDRGLHRSRGMNSTATTTTKEQG